MDLRRYIEERSVPEPNTGCWIWLLALKADDKHRSGGYAKTSVVPGCWLASRVAFEAFHRPLLPGEVVMHSCDHRWCVAPHHLTAGTHESNMLDMAQKGRSTFKLSPMEVRAIRVLAVGDNARGAIAEAFGVTRGTVWSIERRERRAHVA